MTQAVSVGLALGGGGARGFAHVVVLEAFDSLGVRPAVIAGTSMGALIGAAYGAGLSGRDIRAHLLRQFRNRRQVLGRLLEGRVGRFAHLLTRGLTNPVLMDAGRILPLFWPGGTIPDAFEDLAIPLLVVATDLNRREEVVLESGALPDALAASIAVPGLVRPVRREGRLLIDGGAVNPLPYDHLFMRAERVVACDVSPGGPETPPADPKPLAVMLGAAQIMQNALTGRMLRAQPPHLLVTPPVERFRLLDFFHVARLLETAEGCAEPVKRDLAALLERLEA